MTDKPQLPPSGGPAVIPEAQALHSLPQKIVALVCRQCLVRTLGPAAAEGLGRQLTLQVRAALGRSHLRDLRVADTSCLGVCPERAVTVIHPGSGSARMIALEHWPEQAVAAISADVLACGMA